MSDEPQPVQFTTQAHCGHSQDYGADWVHYALNTDPPSVGNVDPSRNPHFGGYGDDGTAIA
jgi:hypothetical protein